MRKRKKTTKERIIPLVIGSGITLISRGVATILFNKAEKAVEEKKSFDAGLLGGIGVTLSTIGSICGILCGVISLNKYEYTDEELDSMLD